jgi:thiol-disulfide isomerase/thioredoxin
VGTCCLQTASVLDIVEMPPLPPDFPPATLEVFYSPTCTPCRLELPAVAEIAARDSVRVRVIILDGEERARAELRAVSAQLEAIAESKVGESPNAVLRDAGNDTGILPYTRSVTPNGAVCAKWSGRLTVARAASLLAACARIIAPLGRSRS